MDTPTQSKSPARLIEGRVVVKSGSKTVAVEVVRVLTHPLYRKSMKRTKRFLVHDEKEEAKVGDVVKIRQCRPISKRKHWKIVSVARNLPAAQVSA
ncbi:MAG: 30S ribosomal protein S17 [Candidatus Andersenbacteria bacterium]|nr:30S ribosomal protein S17 [Candidatus Andersenbacteria bacterium]